MILPILVIRERCTGISSKSTKPQTPDPMILRNLTPILIAFLLVSSSCITNRDVAYLQYDNEYRRQGRIEKNAIVRQYNRGTSGFRLQPGDLLDIKISTLTPSAFNPLLDADPLLVSGQRLSQMSGQAQPDGYLIDPDGFLNLPLIGKTEVAGLTTREAEKAIAKSVEEFLDDPVVRVKLLNFRFTVLGEVNSEATLVSTDEHFTMLQAIGMAGGVSEFGDRSRVKVIRRNGDEAIVFYVNLLSEEFLAGNFYFVQPNDVIVVTPLKQRSYLRYVAPNLSILTSSLSLIIGIVTFLSLR
jgi:polysaccharide biosynthesis/export protein